jgi:hypothetical protein
MDTGQPTHSLLHFLSVRPLQHPFSLRAAWQVCCGAWGKYPVDHIQQANASNAQLATPVAGFSEQISKI